MASRPGHIYEYCMQKEPNAILTHVEILQRWPEREADEVVAGRVEQVPAMCGVDIEEDARDDNRLLLQQLLEEGLDIRDRH